MKTRWFIGLFTLMVLPVYAFSSQDLWVTRDHQAKKLLDTGRYAEATQLFQRQDWRATAAFRAGNYQQAARDYLALGSVDGNYNAGNALAKAGQYQQAIAAYDKALTQDPQHQDALYNKRLVQAMLKKDQQNQKPDQPKDQSKSDKNQGQPAKDKSQQAPPADPSSSKETKDAKKPKAQPQSKKSKPKTNPKPEAAPPQDSKKDAKPPSTQSEREQQEAKAQWLRLIPDDPGGLLREKFLRDHLKRQSAGAS